jgi:hypothetical protein
VRFADDPPRVALMASKEPHCLFDLLGRWRTGELDIDVEPVRATVDASWPDRATRIARRPPHGQPAVVPVFDASCYPRWRSRGGLV